MIRSFREASVNQHHTKVTIILTSNFKSSLFKPNPWRASWNRRLKQFTSSLRNCDSRTRQRRWRTIGSTLQWSVIAFFCSCTALPAWLARSSSFRRSGRASPGVGTRVTSLQFLFIHSNSSMFKHVLRVMANKAFNTITQIYYTQKSSKHELRYKCQKAVFALDYFQDYFAQKIARILSIPEKLVERRKAVLCTKYIYFKQSLCFCTN